MYKFSEIKEWFRTEAHWFCPMISTLIIGTFTLWMTSHQNTLNNIEKIGNVKIQINEALRKKEIIYVEDTIEHLLVPLDNSKETEDFIQSIKDQIDELQNAEIARKHAGENSRIESLVKLFSGEYRKTASKALLKLFKQNEEQVVHSLINGIVNQNDPNFYRINLYIAYTLSKTPSKWSGTEQQINQLKKLQATQSYEQDKTFKKRVDEALRNSNLKQKD
jgi:hypothetical protein